MGGWHRARYHLAIDLMPLLRTFLPSVRGELLHLSANLLAFHPSPFRIQKGCTALAIRPRLVIQLVEHRKLLKQVQHSVRRSAHRFPPPDLTRLLCQSAASAVAAAATASCWLNGARPRSTMGRCFFGALLAPSRSNATSNFCKSESINDAVAIYSSIFSTNLQLESGGANRLKPETR